MDIFSDPERDLSSKREIVLDNGNKYHIQQDPADPYGFWRVHMDKGQVPDHLKGAYTTYPLAKQAVELYVKNTQRKVIEERKSK